jgi:hypothetical protein
MSQVIEGEVVRSIEKNEAFERVWRNRIVGHGMIDPRELVGNPRNFRLHGLAQQEVLEGSLAEVGWIDEVTENHRTGYVLDGHLRVGLALRRMKQDGFPDSPADDTPSQRAAVPAYMVPIKYVDLTDEEEALAIVLYDQVTALADLKEDKLAEVIQEIDVRRDEVRRFIDELLQESQTMIAPAPEAAAEAAEAFKDEMTVDLNAECSVEILCTRADLNEFQATLRKWGRRPTVTVNFNMPED